MDGDFKAQIAITSGTSTTITTSIARTYIVNKGSGAAHTILLPRAPRGGLRITIVDGKGDASSNNITIQDYAANTLGTISTNNGYMTFEAYAGGWLRIG